MSSLLSGGSGEIEAARKNLDMAKKLSAATTQTLRIAKERLKDAKQHVDHAETENNSAMNEVQKAEEYLKRVESKWKVIDVDLDDDDDEKLDGAKKDNKTVNNSNGGSTNLSSSNENTRASSRDNVDEPIIDTRRRSRASTNRRAARRNSAGHMPGVKIHTPSMDSGTIIYTDDSSSENEMENLNKDCADREKRTRDKAKKKKQLQKNKPAESQKQNDTECIDLEEEDSSTQGSFDGVPTDRVLDPKHQKRVAQLKDKFGEDDDYNSIVRRAKNHRGNKHGEGSLRSSPSNNRSKSQKLPKRDFRSFGRARRLERGGGRVMAFDGSDDPLDVVGLRDRSSREKRKHSDSAIEVDNDDDDIMGTIAAASNQRYEDKPKKVVELSSLGIGRTRDGRVGKGNSSLVFISQLSTFYLCLSFIYIYVHSSQEKEPDQ